jgi:hypothetical protein
MTRLAMTMPLRLLFAAQVPAFLDARFELGQKHGLFFTMKDATIRDLGICIKSNIAALAPVQ